MTALRMNPDAFVAKWKQANLSERSASHQHFLDLCDLLGHKKPAEADPEGTWFTFERRAKTTDGGDGWADVWKKGCFAWEYKGKNKHKDLVAAYRQLLKYREALENPPLLVVSDISHTEVHTNFTNTAKQVYRIALDAINDPHTLELLRKVFKGSADLKPGTTPEAVTTAIAERFAHLADGMQQRGIPDREAAHFLMKLLFCLFAESVDLLSGRAFTNTLKNFRRRPRHLNVQLRRLFRSMSKGGAYGPEPIPTSTAGCLLTAPPSC
jgi:MmeI, helicase spacer domain/MmeI, N-terminal domain